MGLPEDQREGARVDPWIVVLACVGATIGVVLRFWTTSHLWLDEALSVNIAKLPLSQIPHALKQDGSPPLYYVLLHLWMRLFGSGDVAVRALSGVISVIALPMGWLAARRVRGATAGWVAVAFASMSPFAIRYGTEARMYALLILLTLLGFLALDRLLRATSLPGAVAVALVAGAIILTHYWGLYLVGVVGLGLLVLAARRRDRASVTAVIAVAAGGVPFLPWVPTFLFHLAHTGTPWATRPNFNAALDAIREWCGGGRPSGQALTLLAIGLVVLAVFGAAEDRWRISLDLRTRPGARAVTAAWLGTLVVGMIIGMTVGAAFVVRYSAVVFPLFVLTVAVGVTVLGDERLRRGCVAAALVLGVFAGHTSVGAHRTEAGLATTAIRQTAQPGDVVVYCPDQLGPAASRLLPGGLVQLTFPNAGAPERVDWVDYAKRNHAAQVAPFAAMLQERAGPHAIYVVWAPNYRTYGKKCETLLTAMAKLRPHNRKLVRASRRYEERMGVVRFAP